MNKKDCDNIAYILSEFGINEPILSRFFNLDDRIEGMYEDWKYYSGRCDKVEERYIEIMEQQFGKLWCLTKAAKVGTIGKDNYEQARKDVYGEDYHPSLFR